MSVSASGDGRLTCPARRAATTSGLGLWRVTTSTVHSYAEAVQSEDIVRRADQGPLALHLLDAPQRELPKSTGLLNLSDYRLDQAFACGVDRHARRRHPLATHV